VYLLLDEGMKEEKVLHDILEDEELVLPEVEEEPLKRKEGVGLQVEHILVIKNNNTKQYHAMLTTSLNAAAVKVSLSLIRERIGLITIFFRFGEFYARGRHSFAFDGDDEVGGDVCTRLSFFY
jgi:hypothetical protein